MMAENVGHCEYCDKDHDLRIACPEYAFRNPDKTVTVPISLKEPVRWWKEAVEMVERMKNAITHK